jgi:integrase
MTRPPRRPNGSGSICVMPDGRARILATVPEGDRKRRRQLGPIYPDEATARSVLAAWNQETTRDGVTLAAYGADVLARRELDGSRDRVEVKDIDNERSVWARHVATSPLAAMEVGSIDASDVDAYVMWLRKRPAVSAITRATGVEHRTTGRTIARETQKHALRLVRAVLEEAHRAGLTRGNPAAGARVAAGGRARDLSDDWLRAGEIDRLLGCSEIPLVDRRAYACAIGLALRLDDLHRVEVAHVHAEHVDVRIAKSENGESERWHRVPIMPWLAPWLRAQLDALRPGARWLFPSRTGDRYNPSHDFGWAEKRETGRPRRPGALERAGIDRRVRFHDLRGTCATHLAIGTWGRAWSLHEIKAMLAHSDQRVTERYVRRATDALADAARLTSGGPAALHIVAHGDSRFPLRALGDSNPRPSAPEACRPSCDRASLARECAARVQRAASEAIAAAAEGSPLALRLALEAVEVGVELAELALATAARSRGLA